jgi:ribosomal protein S18 acetylase RimI-like enzyme
MDSSSSKVWKHRAYRPADKEACLKIFDSNTPQTFLANERDIFAKYLDNHSDGYLVVETADLTVIACGGHVIGLDGGAASLCWGMVDKEWHGKGLGKFLLTNRLVTLAQIPKMKLIRLDAGQRSVEFFMKWGFKTYRITQNHYGPGFHRHEMYLILDDEKIREILSSNI